LGLGAGVAELESGFCHRALTLDWVGESSCRPCSHGHFGQ
jgi:hypothetical protein